MAQLLRGCGAAGWLIGSALFGWAGRGTAPSSPQGDQPPAITLRLNIPAYRLEVFERGILSRSYRTGVGMKDYPTPTGSFAIGHLVWNPRWVPPPAEWAKSDTAMPPGPANPMGRVKLFFAPLYFIHGTPDAGSIGRAFSHGCVRLRNEDATDLAQLVLYYGRDSTASPLPPTTDSLGTRLMRLERPIPIEVSYLLAEVRDERLQLYPDIYGFASTWREFRDLAYLALVAGGVTTAAVDPWRLNPWLDLARRHPVAVPINSLLRTETESRRTGNLGKPFAAAVRALPRSALSRAAAWRSPPR